ncbi:ABC transporter permease [Pseudoxanthomonas wuyuanensis]|uniref:Putative ABC transport system permease protein n=1 Tax=Pseudoxanthomonas wuyuanensis TaxID=1073196 RepID=A0A286DB27_9GAMM|nr:FtsX-like permease family protein [Pseudoxanthomonas wuyuanensis]KAF1721814.1 ABC transporter permease [Pseudoxanthomonas wuyuanensis]SOD55822.1 putative ABC transport system permease protein [Pseudoxanthomonas wuyuanensis]
MDIRPILSTLARHKTAAALIVLEVALSCAIICNAVFLINNRLERMQRPTGLADNEIVRINIGGIGQDEDADARVKQDVASLRALPGVKAANSINHVPFDNSSWNSSVSLQPNQPMPNLSANVYLGEGVIDTFGLTLVEGRDFTADEYQNWTVLNKPNTKNYIHSVILSRDVANKLFPGESAVGKNIYSWNSDDVPHRVVGVVDRLIRTNDFGGPAQSGYTIILPVRDLTMGRFVLRTSPERREEVLKAAVAQLEKNSARRLILREGTFTDVIQDYYRQDRAMAWLLVAVILALLVVTALGIVGLASFWVQQRTKQIGIRRALGATKGQVLRYFQTENFLLASIGIVIGMALAFAINQMLMGKYELPRLPLFYLPVGAVLLWLLGQIAVYGPARKAASVPPAVATRTA